MKQLSQGLKNTLNNAKRIEHSQKQLAHGSTNVAGKMTIATPLLSARQREEEAITRLGCIKNCKIITNSKTKFGAYGAEFETQYEIDGKPDKLEIRKILDILNVTASPILIADKLNELSMVTASKNDDFETYKLKIALYVKKLKDYPADILIEAIDSGFKFFPTLFEIEERVKNKVAIRNMKFRKIMRL